MSDDFYSDSCRICQQDRAARYRSSMAALSRFMVWVWMEARSQELFPVIGTAAIQEALNEALVEGRLRLAWPEGGDRE